MKHETLHAGVSQCYETLHIGSFKNDTLADQYSNPKLFI